MKIKIKKYNRQQKKAKDGKMIQGHWKVKAEQLPDCEKGYWYVTECEVMGVVGVCAESLDQLKEKLKPVIRQMLRLNGTPKNRVHDTAEFGIAA